MKYFSTQKKFSEFNIKNIFKKAKKDLIIYNFDDGTYVFINLNKKIKILTPDILFILVKKYFNNLKTYRYKLTSSFHKDEILTSNIKENIKSIYFDGKNSFIKGELIKNNTIKKVVGKIKSAKEIDEIQNSFRFKKIILDKKNFKKIKSWAISNNYKIKKIDNKGLFKININKNSKIFFENKDGQKNINVYFDEFLSKSNNIIKYEISLRNYLKNNNQKKSNEKNDLKKIIVKYLIFTILMITTLLIVFLFIYKEYSTNESSINTASFLFRKNSILVFLGIFMSGFFYIAIKSLQIKRISFSQGEFIRFHHIFISSLMSKFISWITPFTIGGDAIGYWYLVRKGYNQEKIAGSYLVSTVMFQILVVLTGAIMLPLSIDAFFNNMKDVSIITVMIIYLTGFIIDFIVAIFMFILVISRNFQIYLLNIFIKFFGNYNNNFLKDKDLWFYSFVYKFDSIRKIIKNILTNFRLVFEISLYVVIPFFGIPGVLVQINYFYINNNLKYGKYFSIILANNTIRVSNLFAITPGGHGVTEIINTQIKKTIYIPINSNRTSLDTAIGYDILGKFTSSWPTLTISMLTIFTIIFKEKKKINKKINIL